MSLNTTAEKDSSENNPKPSSFEVGGYFDTIPDTWRHAVQIRDQLDKTQDLYEIGDGDGWATIESKKSPDSTECCQHRLLLQGEGLIINPFTKRLREQLNNFGLPQEDRVIIFEKYIEELKSDMMAALQGEEPREIAYFGPSRGIPKQEVWLEYYQMDMFDDIKDEVENFPDFLHIGMYRASLFPQ